MVSIQEKLFHVLLSGLKHSFWFLKERISRKDNGTGKQKINSEIQSYKAKYIIKSKL